MNLYAQDGRHDKPLLRQQAFIETTSLHWKGHSTLFLGIDIAKATFDVCLFLPETATSTESMTSAHFPNNPKGFQELHRWLTKRKVGHLQICMEATGRYWEELAAFLHQQGHGVSVVNPVRTKRYAESQLKRAKTDRMDARLIAHFCWTQQPQLWHPPTKEQQQLQEMVRYLEALLNMRQQEVNRRQAGVRSETIQDNLNQHIDFLEGQINALKQSIQDHLDQHPGLRQQAELLTSIPGVGDLTAARILSEVPDVSRFEKAGQLAAYAGLTPSLQESGTSVRCRSRLVKTGNGLLRKFLFFPAMVAIRYNPIIVALAQRLRAKGKSEMLIIGAAMRKLLHLCYGVLKSAQAFDPDYQPAGSP